MRMLWASTMLLTFACGDSGTDGAEDTGTDTTAGDGDGDGDGDGVPGEDPVTLGTRSRVLRPRRGILGTHRSGAEEQEAEACDEADSCVPT